MTMKATSLSALLLLPLLGACVSTSTLSGYGGVRTLDDSDLEDVDDQTTVGLDWVWGILPWGLGLELGANYSEEDSDFKVGGNKVDIEVGLLEVYAGARKTFREEHNLRPYLAAGISGTKADFDLDSADKDFDFDDDDFTPGAYARVGLAYHLAIVHFGIDYRFNTAEAEFDDEDVDIDSQLLSVFVGITF